MELTAAEAEIIERYRREITEGIYELRLVWEPKAIAFLTRQFAKMMKELDALHDKETGGTDRR